MPQAVDFSRMSPAEWAKWRWFLRRTARVRQRAEEQIRERLKRESRTRQQLNRIDHLQFPNEDIRKESTRTYYARRFPWCGWANPRDATNQPSGTLSGSWELRCCTNALPEIAVSQPQSRGSGDGMIDTCLPGARVGGDNAGWVWVPRSELAGLLLEPFGYWF